MCAWASAAATAAGDDAAAGGLGGSSSSTWAGGEWASELGVRGDGDGLGSVSPRPLPLPPPVVLPPTADAAHPRAAKPPLPQYHANSGDFARECAPPVHPIRWGAPAATPAPRLGTPPEHEYLVVAEAAVVPVAAVCAATRRHIPMATARAAATALRLSLIKELWKEGCSAP